MQISVQYKHIHENGYMGGSKASSERFLAHLDFSPSPATDTYDLE